MCSSLDAFSSHFLLPIRRKKNTFKTRHPFNINKLTFCSVKVMPFLKANRSLTCSLASYQWLPKFGNQSADSVKSVSKPFQWNGTASNGMNCGQFIIRRCWFSRHKFCQFKAWTLSSVEGFGGFLLEALRILQLAVSTGWLRPESCDSHDTANAFKCSLWFRRAFVIFRLRPFVFFNICNFAATLESLGLKV